MTEAHRWEKISTTATISTFSDALFCIRNMWSDWWKGRHHKGWKKLMKAKGEKMRKKCPWYNTCSECVHVFIGCTQNMMPTFNLNSYTVSEKGWEATIKTRAKCRLCYTSIVFELANHYAFHSSLSLKQYHVFVVNIFASVINRHIYTYTHPTSHWS